MPEGSVSRAASPCALPLAGASCPWGSAGRSPPTTDPKPTSQLARSLATSQPACSWSQQ